MLVLNFQKNQSINIEEIDSFSGEKKINKFFQYYKISGAVYFLEFSLFFLITLFFSQDIALANFGLRLFFWFFSGLYYQRVIFSDVSFFSIKYLFTFFFGPALASLIFINLHNLLDNYSSKLISDIFSSIACYFVISSNYSKK